MRPAPAPAPPAPHSLPETSSFSPIFRPGKHDQDCLQPCLDTSTRRITSSSLFQDWPLDEPHYHRIPPCPPSTSLQASGRIIYTTINAANAEASTCFPQTTTTTSTTSTTVARHGLYRCLFREVEEEEENDAQFHREQKKQRQQQQQLLQPQLLGGFECVVQGDEMFQVLSPSPSPSPSPSLSSQSGPGSLSSNVLLRITDLSSAEVTSDAVGTPSSSIFTLQTGDVFFARNGRKVRWEFFLCRPSTSVNPSSLASTLTFWTDQQNSQQQQQSADRSVDENDEDDERKTSKGGDHGFILRRESEPLSFLKVFYGFKSDGYEKRSTTTTTTTTATDTSVVRTAVETAENDENSEGRPILSPMIHFRWKNNITASNDGLEYDNILDPTLIELEDWPFTNPKSDYKILSTESIPRTSGKIFDAQTYIHDYSVKTTRGKEHKGREKEDCASPPLTDTDTVTRSTRFGLWHCTPGRFECTEQGDELMTVVKGQVTIRDVETNDAVTVRSGQTIFLQHHGRRVVWDVPSQPTSSASSDYDDDDDEAYNGVLKIFYGSIEGTY